MKELCIFEKCVKNKWTVDIFPNFIYHLFEAKTSKQPLVFYVKISILVMIDCCYHHRHHLNSCEATMNLFIVFISTRTMTDLGHYFLEFVIYNFYVEFFIYLFEIGVYLAQFPFESINFLFKHTSRSL